MAKGINKVILVGTLGRDPETKYMPSGGAVTNISLATSEQWKDKSTGERQERTEWHRVVFFNRLAEIAGQYLRKGQQTYIEGSLRTRKWQGQDGQDRYTTEIVASDMQMLGGPRTDNSSAPANYDNGPMGNYDDDMDFGAGSPPSQPQRPAPRPQSKAPVQQNADNDIPFDDDIPF